MPRPSGGSRIGGALGVELGLGRAGFRAWRGPSTADPHRIGGPLLLQQLHDAEYLLRHGPKRIALAEKKVAAAGQDCEAQKAAIKDLKKSADQRNLDLKTSEAEIEKLNGQLNLAKTNKEYDIIRGGIETQQASSAAAVAPVCAHAAALAQSIYPKPYTRRHTPSVS